MITGNKSSTEVAHEAFASRFTIVFISDMEKLKQEHAQAIKNEQVWRAEWEQISEVARVQHERIEQLEAGKQDTINNCPCEKLTQVLQASCGIREDEQNGI